MDVCNSSWDELSLVIVADLVQWSPWGGFLVFSMAARYSWLQLSTPNKPCRGVRQSLVFVIMASNWGFCYLDLDGGGILGFANWFLWDWGVVYHWMVALVGGLWWRLWGGVAGLWGYASPWMVALVLDYCWLCTNKFFLEAFLPNMFFCFCFSQKKLIIINFSKHIFVLKTSKNKKVYF